MKTRSKLISLGAIMLIAGTILFVRSKTKLKTDPADIVAFLNKFNSSVNERNTDTLMAYFKAPNKTKTFGRLTDLLLNKNNTGATPPANIFLDVNKAIIKTTPDGMTLAIIPVLFSHDLPNSKKSILILKIVAITPGNLKIIQVDSRRFFEDYITYVSHYNKTLTQKR